MRILFHDFLRIFHVLSWKLKLRTLELFAVMVVASLMELAVINSLANMGMSITASGMVKGGFFYRHLFAYFPSLEILCRDDRVFLLVAGCVVIASSLIKNLLLALSTYRTGVVGEDISVSIGAEILERYLYRDYAWHLTAESESMLQRMLWRANVTAMLMTVLSMYAAFITLLVLFFSLMAAEPLLTSFTLISTSLCGVVVYVTLRKMVDSNAVKVAKAAEDETRAILCTTKGIRDVLIYGKQAQFLSSITSAAQRGKTPRVYASLAPAIPSWILETIGFAIIVACMGYLALVENAGLPRMTSALALLTLTAWRVLPYCNRIVSFQVVIRGLRPLSSGVIDLLTGLRALPFSVPPAADPSFHFRQSLELKNVSFRYTSGGVESLHDINLRIPCGAKVGLIGQSGAGKSTLAGVLSGLLPPTAGELWVDGVKVDRQRMRSFTAKIGYVPQSPFLFAGSLAENIAFSNWGHGFDERRVREVCTMAAIDFVDSHPQGIYQPIGENGSGLSGGQAQRVAIARALYNNPDILIFDEATSALDGRNENTIINTIYGLPKNITAIIIAHRLSTVEKCDLVVHMQAGQLVEMGKPEVILPKYAVLMQQSGVM